MSLIDYCLIMSSAYKKQEKYQFSGGLVLYIENIVHWPQEVREKTIQYNIVQKGFRFSAIFVQIYLTTE